MKCKFPPCITELQPEAFLPAHHKKQNKTERSSIQRSKTRKTNWEKNFIFQLYITTID